MAFTVFSNNPGRVLVLTDPAVPSRFSFNLEAWDGFETLRAIITRVTVSKQGNYQFLHSLGGTIYIYVFGDRIGQITVSGVAFERGCEEDETGRLGIENVQEFYETNRLANRELPLKLTIGVATTFVAYLVGAATSVVDEGMGLWQFALQLSLIPETAIAAGTLSDTLPAVTDTTPPAAEDVGSLPDYSISSAALAAADAGGFVHDAGYVLPVSGVAGYAAVGSGPPINLARAQVLP